MSGLKLISLNIERSLHLDTVLPLLREEKPDVVCAQELLARDIPVFAELLGPCIVFAPDGLHPADPPETEPVMEGCAIFSKLPTRKKGTTYYVGSQEHALLRESHTIPSDNSLVWAEVVCDDIGFFIATTHFTWTPEGKPTEKQRQDLDSMLSVLATHEDFVLCGDFNMPRGGELFTRLAGLYKDNIPLDYKTSLDIDIHRAGKTQAHELSDKMVDGLFTTPAYAASNVSLVKGVSDHMAIVATLAKRSK